MYGMLNRPRKRQRRDHCRYLLTSRSTWIIDEAIPATSALLVVSYNDTIQFEQTVVKEESDTENFKAVDSATFLLPTGAENEDVVEVDKDAESEDTLYIKFEEDCEKANEIDHKHKDSLIETDEDAESIGRGLKDNDNGDTGKDINEKLKVGKSFSSVYGRIKTVDGEVFYECEFCTKLFKRRSRIALHRRSHTKEKIFKCDRCTESFSSISVLNRHINNVHNKREFTAKCTNGKFECDKCCKTYSTLTSLKGHTCKMFKCDKCNSTCSTLETLNHHICKTFKCDMCSKAYISLKSLKSHICKGKDSLIDTDKEAESKGTKLKDNSNGNATYGDAGYGQIKTVEGEVFYGCDFCTKLFKDRSHIAEHRQSHTKERMYKCERCTESFMSNRGLNRHINTIHNELEITIECTNGKFECDKCRKLYSCLESLKCHTCKTFKCDKCNETYNTIETLKHHFCKRFKCDVCSRAYINLHSLKIHDCKAYRCEKCEKVFHNEQRLLQHVKFECYYTALEALKTSKLGAHKPGK